MTPSRESDSAIEPRTEWRVSWTMWPHGWPAPRRVERVTDAEDEVRDQLTGLKSMLADHELRPCDDHVWEVRLERRVVEMGVWRVIE